MNKKTKQMRSTFILLLGLFSISLFGQQQPLFDHYMFNLSSVNPAAVGIKPSIESSMIYRNQWMGLQNQNNNNINPQSFVASANMPLYNISSGAGINIIYDKLAQETNLGLELNYAYHMKFGKKHKLSAGAALCFRNKSIDFPELFALNETNPIFESKESAMYADFNLGLFYHQTDKLFAGISVNNLLQNTSEIGPIKYKNESLYYLTAGYQIQLNGEQSRQLTLTPSLLFRITPTTFSYDINMICTYKNQYWGGLIYRKGESIGLMGGINYKQFSLGLSYDYCTNKIGNYSNGSIEVFLAYSMPFIRKLQPKSFYNTRYL
jgi:type IX secretion system PorP/SprF family membrane protein